MDLELEAVAKRFVEKYYRTFDANRADLVNLYQEESVLIFHGWQFRGKEAILAKLTSLPFQQCQHHIGAIDCQPSHLITGGVVVLVVGNIWLDGEEDALYFAQTFYLIPAPEEGSFYISRDLLRMVKRPRLDILDSTTAGPFSFSSLYRGWEY